MGPSGTRLDLMPLQVPQGAESDAQPSSALCDH